MKIRLTREESAHLISLGVPKEKASETELEYVVDKYYPSSLDSPKRKTAHIHRIFKLEDFLTEILPKEIEIPVFYDGLEEPEYYTKYRIAFEWDSSNFTEVEPQYNAFYKEIAFIPGGYLAKFSSEELIDALYQLACWYYGEYLKSEKK